MNFHFQMPVQICLEKDCIENNAGLISKLGKRALVVTDGVAAQKNGSLSDVLDILTKLGIPSSLFDKVSSNPTVECARQGAQQIIEEKADIVIAIGGGSTLDAGKAMCLLCRQPDLSDDQLLAGEFMPETIPLVAIPTTSGTGSEVTSFAMLTSTALQKKININSAAMYARLALLDPKYTMTAPRQVTVNTSIDAMSHAIEGLLTVSSNSCIKAIATESLQRIGSCLGKLVNDSMDYEARSSMMFACVLAGIAVGQTRTSALHGISYPMTFYRHLPHGRAIGLLLIPYLRFTASVNPELIQNILNPLGVSSVDELQDAIDSMLGEKDILTEDEIMLFASESSRARNIKNSIVPPTENDIRWILKSI